MLYSVYYRNTPAWYISHDFIINYYYSLSGREGYKAREWETDRKWSELEQRVCEGEMKTEFKIFIFVPTHHINLLFSLFILSF